MHTVTEGHEQVATDREGNTWAVTREDGAIYIQFRLGGDDETVDTFVIPMAMVGWVRQALGRAGV